MFKYVKKKIAGRSLLYKTIAFSLIVVAMTTCYYIIRGVKKEVDVKEHKENKEEGGVYESVKNAVTGPGKAIGSTVRDKLGWDKEKETKAEDSSAWDYVKSFPSTCWNAICDHKMIAGGSIATLILLYYNPFGIPMGIVKLPLTLWAYAKRFTKGSIKAIQDGYNEAYNRVMEESRTMDASRKGGRNILVEHN